MHAVHESRGGGSGEHVVVSVFFACSMFDKGFVSLMRAMWSKMGAQDCYKAFPPTYREHDGFAALNSFLHDALRVPQPYRLDLQLLNDTFLWLLNEVSY